eukprot:3936439-Rhodomonas_salina.5
MARAFRTSSFSPLPRSSSTGTSASSTTLASTSCASTAGERERQFSAPMLTFLAPTWRPTARSLSEASMPGQRTICSAVSSQNDAQLLMTSAASSWYSTARCHDRG